MGRIPIYWNAADKQAAYRRRRAGATVDVTPATFDASVECLQRLVREAEDLPLELRRSVRALIDAVSNRQGYRQWQIERQRADS